MGFFYERQGEAKKILSLTPTHTQLNTSNSYANFTRPIKNIFLNLINKKTHCY